MEILDVFDENGNIIGQAERSKVHKEGLWHIHVGVWIMNEKGEILLEKRAECKKVNPNKWTRVGGHVDAGEKPEIGIQRELLEEVGLNISPNEFELIEITKFNEYSEKLKLYNRSLVYNYFAYTTAKLEDYILQIEEVSDVKYITIEEMIDICNREDENYTFTKWSKDSISKTIEFLTKKKMLVSNHV